EEYLAGYLREDLREVGLDAGIRHCEERSDEAIHRAASGKMDCFASLAMTAWHAFAFSRLVFRPSSSISFPSSKTEGAGNARCTLHPRSRVPKNCAFGAHEHTGERKHSDIPCAMALRLTSCSPRWSGLVVTVTLRKLPARLSASIAAPGPHDFAVRLGVFV